MKLKRVLYRQLLEESQDTYSKPQYSFTFLLRSVQETRVSIVFYLGLRKAAKYPRVLYRTVE